MALTVTNPIDTLAHRFSVYDVFGSRDYPGNCPDIHLAYGELSLKGIVDVAAKGVYPFVGVWGHLHVCDERRSGRGRKQSGNGLDPVICLVSGGV